jgi:hypothetical protein
MLECWNEELGNMGNRLSAAIPEPDALRLASDALPPPNALRLVPNALRLK